MSPREIEVGKTYHNGKQGPRSYSARRVVALNVRYSSFTDGIRFLQIAGRFKGEESVISMSSFATWAKGEVTSLNE
jgi:hypothetical protein